MSYIAVGCAVVSIGVSIAGNSSAKKQAEKNREAQLRIAFAQMAEDEKIALEKLRIEREIATTGILASSLLEYRKTLQVESTARLKDTGIYVAMLGFGMGSFYGLYLMVAED
jgi:hypothetical protein